MFRISIMIVFQYMYVQMIVFQYMYVQMWLSGCVCARVCVCVGVYVCVSLPR
jgi:uncharacterized protein YqfA (UPF0365 family)